MRVRLPPRRRARGAGALVFLYKVQLIKGLWSLVSTQCRKVESPTHVCSL